MSEPALNHIIQFPVNSDSNKVGGKRLTVLIASLNDSHATRLLNVFSKDFNVVRSISGEQTLGIIFRDQVDLALIDTSLTDMSAISMCKQIKKSQISSNTDVVITSRKASLIDHEAALMAGAINCFLHKISPKAIHSRISDHLALVAEKKKLEVRCCVDGLTGLTNKMQFNTVLNKEWHSAMRGEYPLAVVMIDIDNFKLFNDHFGHLEGDNCLIKVAKAIDSSKRREEDLTARFGGEEFVMLLPFTDQEGAYKVANKILDKVRNLNIAHSEDSAIPIVTVSAGVASCNPSYIETEGFSAQDLLARADMNLYRAKDRGRNRCV